MYKFNIPTLLLFSLVTLGAWAQTTEPNTDVDIDKFKATNLELGISNDSFDPDFFASDVWNNYLKNGMIHATAKHYQLDPKDCKVTTKAEKHFMQCKGMDETDVTTFFNVSKKMLETNYAKGAVAYASNKDVKSAPIEVPLEKKVTPTTATPYISGPFGQEFWDSQMEGHLVEIKESDKQKMMAKYTWGDPNAGLTEKYSWKANDDYKPIIISPNLGEPVVVTPKLIVLNEEIVLQTDNSVVQKDNVLITNPIIKLEEEKKEEENKDDGSALTLKGEEVIVKEEKKEEKETGCKEKLDLEIAKLLEQDEKNIIGLQFELTVLKMASAATGAQTKTLEGLIKQHSTAIKSIDTGIIDKMNVMYKAHGLAEDATSITELLKEKTTDASYYPKYKRFFNQDSSAFLLAYQSLNPDQGIKDSDVSVLWFMDKVSEKAKSEKGQFSSVHNRTNLSTRIAQYTGAIDPTKAISKVKLDEMVTKQKSKIDAEFLALIESFKQSNLACYNELFADGENECNIGKIEATFSELLAINSKIASTDLVSLDGQLKGEINGKKFSISKYVD